jgi:hypothetical protein
VGSIFVDIFPNILNIIGLALTAFHVTLTRLTAFDMQTGLQLLLALASASIFFLRSLSRVQVLSHMLEGCRVHSLYGCFFFWTL